MTLKFLLIMAGCYYLYFTGCKLGIGDVLVSCCLHAYCQLKASSNFLDGGSTKKVLL